MSEINCIIVEDEPMAAEVVTEYTDKIPYLNLKGIFRNGFEALEFIEKNDVDLIFLDINMPDITGLQFVKLLKQDYLVIFTTAYSQYAIESYEYNAIDYLLKPIEWERFLKSVSKARDQFNLLSNQGNKAMSSENIPAEEYLYIKSGSQIHKINPNDLLYIEGAGNYITYKTKSKSIMVFQSLSNAENQLDENMFCRVHKSYIISIKHIDTIEVHQLSIGDKKIPLGRSYRKAFLELIDDIPD